MIESTKFRNKKTGEIATQIPLFEMNDWEELKEEIKPEKKLPSKVQLYNQMWMRNNGEIIYVTSSGDYTPFKFNLKVSAPKQFQKIVDTYGTKEGKKVREQTFYGIAKLME